MKSIIALSAGMISIAMIVGCGSSAGSGDSKFGPEKDAGYDSGFHWSRFPNFYVDAEATNDGNASIDADNGNDGGGSNGNSNPCEPNPWGGGSCSSCGWNPPFTSCQDTCTTQQHECYVTCDVSSDSCWQTCIAPCNCAYILCLESCFQCNDRCDSKTK